MFPKGVKFDDRWLRSEMGYILQSLSELTFRLVSVAVMVIGERGSEYTNPGLS